MATEKRRAPRFRIDQMVEMHFGHEHTIRSQGLDLSEVGLRCRTDVLLEAGTRVFLMMGFGPGEDDVVSCEGVVARSGTSAKGWEVGVAFTELSPAMRSRLKAFLSGRPDL